MLHYLREPAPGDEVARADAVRSLCDLAERFAPDHAWFVDTMNELFEVAGERCSAGMGQAASVSPVARAATCSTHILQLVYHIFPTHPVLFPPNDSHLHPDSQARWCRPAWPTT